MIICCADIQRHFEFLATKCKFLELNVSETAKTAVAKVTSTSPHQYESNFELFQSAPEIIDESLYPLSIFLLDRKQILPLCQQSLRRAIPSIRS